jgi:peptidoglycan/xylan/chitin deacetylase (PgdA/CDA1 family)
MPHCDQVTNASTPGNAGTVVVLTIALDGETPVLAAGRRYAEHAMVMSHQAFEPHVAVPRLLDLLAAYSVPATFFIPGFAAERSPAMVEAVLAAGHEVAHHSYSHRPPTSLSEADDRQEFERGLEALDRFGIKPAGYRAPMWSASWRTPELVREYGMIYDSSLMDDDKAYVLQTSHGDLAEIPPHWSLDDWEQYAYLPAPHLGYHINNPLAVSAMWTSELAATRRYGGTFVLTGHGFLSGRAGRIEGLRQFIESAFEFGDVEFRNAYDVARAALSDVATERKKHERVDVDSAIYPDW